MYFLADTCKPAAIPHYLYIHGEKDVTKIREVEIFLAAAL